MKLILLFVLFAQAKASCASYAAQMTSNTKDPLCDATGYRKGGCSGSSLISSDYVESKNYVCATVNESDRCERQIITRDGIIFGRCKWCNDTCAFTFNTLVSVDCWTGIRNLPDPGRMHFQFKKCPAMCFFGNQTQHKNCDDLDFSKIISSASSFPVSILVLFCSLFLLL
jgi:hypothetical protein